MELSKVFISYCYKNDNKRKATERLIKKSKKLDPIVIATQRQSGITLEEKVKHGINTCKYFVPILTPESLENQWVNQEIGYATAKGKPVFPIVDSAVLHKLKGFVHNQIDLPYHYSSVRNDKSDRYRFRCAVKKLIQDLISIEYPEENSHYVAYVNTMPDMEGLFRGTWECSYSNEEKSGIDRSVKVIKNEYYIGGVKKFNLSDYFLNGMQTMFKYTKNGTEGDNRKIRGKMNIIDLYRHYEGEEINSETGRWSVVYKRIE